MKKVSNVSERASALCFKCRDDDLAEDICKLCITDMTNEVGEMNGVTVAHVMLPVLWSVGVG